MSTPSRVAAGFLLFAATLGLSQESPAGQNWTHYVRIGAYGLGNHSAEQIVRNTQESNVFGIEVDNDIPGRYESFVNPEEKLQAIRTVAEKAHQAGNRAYVYSPARNASLPMLTNPHIR
jgi:hypothetical protein